MAKKARGINAGRRLVKKHKKYRWSQHSFVVRALNLKVRSDPLEGSWQAKGIVLEKVQFVSEDLPYSKLKKMIREAMPSEELWEYREIRAYFRCVESMFARISEFSDQLSRLVLLRAVEYAIRRLDYVLESIDDPGDCCEAPMEMLLDLHLSVISRLGWTLSELASYLVDRSLADCWHPFQFDPYLYADRIGGDFRVTIAAEIDSRLNALLKVSFGGAANREQTGLLLAQLQEQLRPGLDE